MALTEERVLGSVQILPQQAAVNVEWHDLIKRDGEVISKTNHNKAYTAEQYHDFLAEVEGAEAYIAVLGWTEPVPVEPEPEEAPEPEPEPEEAPVEEPAPVEPDPEQ